MDEGDRTTAMGLFNTADAYRASAMALEKVPLRKEQGIGHAARPGQFLYSHAIALYLKALLRTKYSVETIRKNFRHDITLLMNEAEKLGLAVADEDRETTDALIELRYIETGSKPSLDGLGQTSKNVRDGVGELLRKEVCWCGCKEALHDRSVRLSAFNRDGHDAPTAGVEIRGPLERSHLDLCPSGSGLCRAGRDDHRRDSAKEWLADRRLHRCVGQPVDVHLIQASGRAVSCAMPCKL